MAGVIHEEVQVARPPVAEAREVQAEQAAAAAGLNFVVQLCHTLYFSAATFAQHEQIKSAAPFWSSHFVDENELPAGDEFDYEFPLTPSGRVKVVARHAVLPDPDWDY